MTEPCPCGYTAECPMHCGDGHATGACPPRHPAPAAYDSTADTLQHSRRVAELISPLAAELVQRGIQHDRSKTEPPEVGVFNEYTPKLKNSTYGSDEYKSFLAGMGAGLAHHYASNRHHPEHFTRGVDGMTLVDLLEMLADWKAATERHADGDLRRSLAVQRDRFGLSDQLVQILTNTAAYYDWLPGQPAVTGPRETCGVAGTAPDGDALDCNQAAGHERDNRVPGARVHCDGSRDNLCWNDGEVSGL